MGLRRRRHPDEICSRRLPVGALRRRFPIEYKCPSNRLILFDRLQKTLKPRVNLPGVFYVERFLKQLIHPKSAMTVLDKA